MSTQHAGNIQPGLDLEEHDGTNNAKRVNVVAGSVSIDASDIEIGAVEIKNGTDDTRLELVNVGQASDDDHKGTILFARHDSSDGHTDESDGEYDALSMDDFDALRIADQRVLDLDKCNATTGWTGLNTDTPTANIAVSTNHVFGTGALSFDKVDGAADTIYGCIQKTVSPTIDAAEIFEAGGFVGYSIYIPDTTNVTGAFLRIGTDSTNYNTWWWPVSELTAATWLNLRTAAALPNYTRNTGNGWNPGAISYIAVGVEFSSEANTLDNILVDHIHMVKGRVTSTDITTSTQTSVSTANINLAKVGNATTASGNGTVTSGTLRVTLASNSSGVVGLNAGTNAIGKLTANSGVDIGDVDVTSIAAGNNNIGDVDIASIAAGTNTIGAVNVKPATTGGLTLFRSIDLDESEEEVKGSAGQLFGWYMFNAAAATQYVKLYNATAANVTVGTTTPVLTIPIPAGSAANVEFTNGIAFSTAITAAATTGVADNDTGAPAANSVVVNLFYA